MEKARQYTAVTRRLRLVWVLGGVAALAVIGAVFLQKDASETSIAAAGLPSGQTVTLQEFVWGAPGAFGLTVRFHFLAPQIARSGGGIGFEKAEEDMMYLCETYALPRIARNGPRPSQIIISLSDRIVPFGATDSEATQFFEAYRPEGDNCIWESL